MDYLAPKQELFNSYALMRHGLSVPNAHGVICSDPETATHPNMGLVLEGRVQATIAANALKKAGRRPRIFTSDYARAHQTAIIVATITGSDTPTLVTALRERSFGRLEGRPVSWYTTVWERDRTDATQTHDGVESVEHVLARTTLLLSALEAKYEGEDILLVSHGDTLQILQTAFERRPASDHRSLPHLSQAEVRPVALHRW